MQYYIHLTLKPIQICYSSFESQSARFTSQFCMHRTQPLPFVVLQPAWPCGCLMYLEQQPAPSLRDFGKLLYHSFLTRIELEHLAYPARKVFVLPVACLQLLLSGVFGRRAL